MYSVPRLLHNETPFAASQYSVRPPSQTCAQTNKSKTFLGGSEKVSGLHLGLGLDQITLKLREDETRPDLSMAISDSEKMSIRFFSDLG